MAAIELTDDELAGAQPSAPKAPIQLSDEEVAGAVPTAGKPEEPPGALETGVRAAGRMASFGFGPAIEAGLNTVRNGGSYRDNLAALQARREAGQAAHPIAAAIGNTLGGVAAAGPAALAPGLAAEGAAQSIATGAASGAGQGMLQGAGEATSNGEDLPGYAKAVAHGGAVGGLVGGGLSAAGAGIKGALAAGEKGASERLAKRAYESMGEGAGKDARIGLEEDVQTPDRSVMDAIREDPKGIREAAASPDRLKALRDSAEALGKAGGEKLKEHYAAADQRGYVPYTYFKNPPTAAPMDPALEEATAATEPGFLAIRGKDVDPTRAEVNEEAKLISEAYQHPHGSPERQRLLKASEDIRAARRLTADPGTALAKREAVDAEVVNPGLDVRNKLGPVKPVTDVPFTEPGASKYVAPDEPPIVGKSVPPPVEGVPIPGTGRGIPAGATAGEVVDTMNASIKRMENGVPTERAAAKNLANIRDEFLAAHQGDMGKVVPLGKLRAEMTNRQGLGYGKAYDPTLIPGIEANKQASKDIGDVIVRKVTGMSYKDAKAFAEANPDSTVAAFMKANDQVKAAHKILGVVDAKRGAEEGSGMVSKFAHSAHARGLSHAAVGAAMGAKTSILNAADKYLEGLSVKPASDDIAQVAAKMLKSGIKAATVSGIVARMNSQQQAPDAR